MRRKIKILKEESGSALLLFSLSFVVVVGVAGLVIDGGMLYNTRSHLKKTANSAVLSGAQELTNNEDSVNTVVKNIINAHEEIESLKELQIKPNNENKVRVELEKEVPVYFMKLFKINSIKVKVASSAEIAPMNRASGAVPLGIDENIPLEYMKEYSLKVDSGDSLYGNFGVLALSGPGAKLYEQDLAYGYDGELKTGDIVDTETGNIEGKTRNAINSRIAACPYSTYDANHRECPRIVLILVYKPYNVESNQMKSVEISGYAYFYIKEPMGSNDSSIKGYFIKRTGTGFGDKNGVDNGAYAIRLTE
jgi:hypothetical protein